MFLRGLCLGFGFWIQGLGLRVFLGLGFLGFYWFSVLGLRFFVFLGFNIYDLGLNRV